MKYTNRQSMRTSTPITLRIHTGLTSRLRIVSVLATTTITMIERASLSSRMNNLETREMSNFLANTRQTVSSLIKSSMRCQIFTKPLRQQEEKKARIQFPLQKKLNQIKLSKSKPLRSRNLSPNRKTKKTQKANRSLSQPTTLL